MRQKTQEGSVCKHFLSIYFCWQLCKSGQPSIWTLQPRLNEGRWRELIHAFILNLKTRPLTRFLKKKKGPTFTTGYFLRSSWDICGSGFDLLSRGRVGWVEERGNQRGSPQDYIINLSSPTGSYRCRQFHYYYHCQGHTIVASAYWMQHRILIIIRIPDTTQLSILHQIQGESRFIFFTHDRQLSAAANHYDWWPAKPSPSRWEVAVQVANCPGGLVGGHSGQWPSQTNTKINHDRVWPGQLCWCSRWKDRLVSGPVNGEMENIW